MFISSAFESGNIRVVDDANPQAVKLEICADNESQFYQWFYFRVSGARGTALGLDITNAGTAAYPRGWEDYRAVACEDGDRWLRVPTSYRDGVLRIEHTPATDCVAYAYFAPYPNGRHDELAARVAHRDGVQMETLGTSIDGAPIDLLTLGEGPAKCWFLARQHPGESMGGWWMEGLLERLTDRHDPIARGVRALATVHVVPNMNPDGVRRGHLRTNAAGTNLNREWAEPSSERSPEVALVRTRMEAVGCDFALDVHGDEALPYNFIAGMLAVPSLSDAQRTAHETFTSALVRASPDFQTRRGYPTPAPGKADLRICANWIAERFGGFAGTLEMPFKDTADSPDALEGWSPGRCRHLGAATVSALHQTLSSRAESP